MRAALFSHVVYLYYRSAARAPGCQRGRPGRTFLLMVTSFVDAPLPWSFIAQDPRIDSGYPTTVVPLHHEIDEVPRFCSLGEDETTDLATSTFVADSAPRADAWPRLPRDFSRHR